MIEMIKERELMPVIQIIVLLIIAILWIALMTIAFSSLADIVLSLKKKK